MINWRKPTIYFLSWLEGSKRMRYLKQILKYQKYSIAEIKKLQGEKLKKILLHSYNNVPYYNRVLGEVGVIKNGKVYLENFHEIPILTKEIIRKEGSNLYSKDHPKRKSYENTSGGSTGEPVRFLQDREYDDWNVANKMYYKHIAGQEIGRKELRFWGSERDFLEGKESLKIRVRSFLFNRKEFNTFQMKKKDMRSYVDNWNEYKPEWVESYVQSIFEFAKFIKEEKLKIHPPKNGILTSAGTLDQNTKRFIEKVFDCKVYNRYGSREVGDMAFGASELRLSQWNHYLEIKKSKIYVSTLNNFSMPMIRYDIGDLGEISNKPGYIKKVFGREGYVLKSRSRKITGGITEIFGFRKNGELFSSFSGYQIVQENIDGIKIRMVVDKENIWQSEKREIEERLHGVFGDDFQVDFEKVECIEPAKSGKYQYIINKLL